LSALCRGTYTICVSVTTDKGWYQLLSKSLAFHLLLLFPHVTLWIPWTPRNFAFIC